MYLSTAIRATTKKTFRCAEYFRVMAFAQPNYRESPRDIESCLRTMEPNLYHMGIHSTVSRNNLSNANGNHDWRIYGGRKVR